MDGCPHRWPRAVRCWTGTDAEVRCKKIPGGGSEPSWMWTSLMSASTFRKQYGTENVILSDIKKPPPHIYTSGMQKFAWKSLAHHCRVTFELTWTQPDVSPVPTRPICVRWRVGLQASAGTHRQQSHHMAGPLQRSAQRRRRGQRGFGAQDQHHRSASVVPPLPPPCATFGFGLDLEAVKLHFEVLPSI